MRIKLRQTWRFFFNAVWRVFWYLPKVSCVNDKTQKNSINVADFRSWSSPCREKGRQRQTQTKIIRIGKRLCSCSGHKVKLHTGMWINILYRPWEMKIWCHCLCSISRLHTRCHSCIFLSPDSFFSASRSLKKKKKSVCNEKTPFYCGFPHFVLRNLQNDSKGTKRTYSCTCTWLRKHVHECVSKWAARDQLPEGFQPPFFIFFLSHSVIWYKMQSCTAHKDIFIMIYSAS